jgi:hypothetical protein
LVDRRLLRFELGQQRVELRLLLLELVLLATEISFSSNLIGSGHDWMFTTGLSDEETLSALRRIQKKVPVGKEPEGVTLASVVHTPAARVGARADPRNGSVFAIGALDNLLKGAASQACRTSVR